MSDANHVSQVRREAARARWGNQVAAKAAETVIERADQLDDDQAEDVMMAVVRGPFAALLPPRSVRLIAAEDRVERAEARRAERELEARRDAAHERALASFREGAETRGDTVTVMGLVNGEGIPSVQQVLERVRDETERQDAYAEKFRPGGHKPDEITYNGVMAAPPSPPPMTPIGRAMASGLRRFAQEYPDAGVVERARFAAELKADLRRNGVR